MVCGYKDSVEICHIVDEKRSELLVGVPDAPDVNDVRNFIQLCPNHHTSFDHYEWTLVEERSVPFKARKCQATGYALHLSNLLALISPCICLPSFNSINLLHLHISFLLKQLGRFEVPCRVCNKLFSAGGIWSHYHAQHKKRKKEWRDLPPLLPHIPDCHCDGRGDNPWQLYCHVVKHHPQVLYR